MPFLKKFFKQQLLVYLTVLFCYSAVSQSIDDAVARIDRDVKILSHDSLQGRRSGTVYEIKSKEYIISEFKKMGLKPVTYDSIYFQPFAVDGHNAIYYNALGFLDNNAAKTIVVGAHFDHMGVKRSFQKSGDSDDIFNGADDNASGVAAMLELVRNLSAMEGLNYNYLFVAFGAEELGLIGSNFFVNSFVAKDLDIALMINFDMVGRLGAYRNKLIVFGLGTAPELKQIVKKNKQDLLKIRKVKLAPGFSDHAPFYQNNIPYLYFTTGLHPDYHTPFDTYEKLNIEGLAKIVSYVTDLTVKLDKLETINFTQGSAFHKFTGTIFSIFLLL